MRNFLGIALCWSVSLFSQTPEVSSTTKLAPAFTTVMRPHAVDGHHTYYRLLTVVPMTGSGTHEDPKRPLHVPVNRLDASSRQDIIAFTQLPSDDRKFAIVEFVAADRAAFKSILADTSLHLFEKGKDSDDVIEAFLQKYRKGFKLQGFGAVTR